MAKIFKLLVGEFNDHLESALASAQDNGDQSGPDDSDEEWEDEESESPTKQMDSNGKNWKQIGKYIFFSKIFFCQSIFV